MMPALGAYPVDLPSLHLPASKAGNFHAVVIDRSSYELFFVPFTELLERHVPPVKVGITLCLVFTFEFLGELLRVRRVLSRLGIDRFLFAVRLFDLSASVDDSGFLFFPN